ncbi:MAG: DUF4962 domain-containing protein [Prevotellaceae bacterium]|jgi:hypothetical protein|nr:DUF4962 domain-containing protein [Prevotellaceae bacterium]
MKKIISIIILITSFSYGIKANDNRIVLEKKSLMHETRATESPLNRIEVIQNPPPLMWPLPYSIHRAPLDGFESKKEKEKKITYIVRLSTDSLFKKNTTEAKTEWTFYNIGKVLEPGSWYWQYAYIFEDEEPVWSPIYKFTITKNATVFSPPATDVLLKSIPNTHPRVLLSKDNWDNFIEKSKGAKQREWYIKKSESVLEQKINSINDIDTSKLGELDNTVKRKAYLTRESRRIVDREEANIEALVRTYLLTKDARYAKGAMDRIEELISWNGNPLIVGDFNNSVMLSISTLGYDAFYDILTPEQKELLLNEIKTVGNKFYKEYANHLENHIADNHVWQMTLRILTTTAIATYRDIPEAEKWVTYCYNVWLARFPGLNDDGAWHNGDSYFHVNIRTLVEVPALYSRLTEFDFFSDPWYNNSVMYVIYNQPPFSKSGGNGSSHQKVVTPNGPRLLYAEAIARMTGNTYAADYVCKIEKENPNLRHKAFLSKSGDLTWFLLQCDKPMPKGKGLNDLSLAHVFPQSGLAIFQSNWSDYRKNAMVSFRSSPYGSTSHAIANQNAFNTFYGGKSLFYSSGHHTAFTDQHGVYSHRATRAHNSILVNGMGQRIGVEGYGWISRYYVGKDISYVLGDASNAYGEVISSLWLERGQLSEVYYTPENGWDKNRLKLFRRHLIELESAELIVIYDELEADTSVTWSYLLHTIENPMDIVSQNNNLAHVRATNSSDGVSDAYLYSTDKVTITETDTFFYPAINWLRADDKGHFAPYENHWHLTAKTGNREKYNFLTIISTHDKSSKGVVPVQKSNGVIEAGNWTIKYNIKGEGKPELHIENKKKKVLLECKGVTRIKEEGKTVELKDQLPNLEI